MTKKRSMNGTDANQKTPRCVARGTRIKTPDGWSPIEQLEKGDKIMAWDHEAEKTVVTSVVANEKARREVVALEFSSNRLRLTSDHPIWSPERKSYEAASEWVTGELEVLTRITDEGPIWIELQGRSLYDGVAEVFDISVEHELHNFIAEGYVLHNKSLA